MDLSLNDPQLCFDAFSKRALKTNLAGNRWEVLEVSGEVIALEFARQAAQQLSSKEFAQLVYFLERSGTPIADFDRLEAEVEKSKKDFYSREMKLSNQDEETFAQPAGSLDADVGIVLHLESKDFNYGNMFHEDSATIRLLQDKGVQPHFVFGMDWHWRGESRKEFSERRTCHFLKFREDIRALHDNFSWQLLEMIRAPFIITGAACARNGIRKRLPLASRLRVNNLEFDLDFRPEGLRRVYLHLPHPTAGFYSSKALREKIAYDLDAGWNFTLWLIGEPHSQTTFRTEYGNVNSDRIVRCIPFLDVHQYRDIEKREKRKLQLTDYTPAFRRFAVHYLKNENVDTASTAAGSVTERIWQKMTERMSSSGVKREETRRQVKKQCRAQQKGEYCLKSVQGDLAHLSSYGYVRIKRKLPLRDLVFRITPEKSRKLQQIVEMRKGTLQFHMTLDKIELRVDGTVIFERSLEMMLSAIHPEDWIALIAYETILLGQSLKLEPRNSKRIFSAPFIPNAFQGQHRPFFSRKMACGFNGLQFHFPDAVGDSVFFQADLVTEGLENPHRVSPITPEGDPGRRLAMKVKYLTKKGSVERWAHLTGIQNMKKINTLADYLDGRDRDWIAKQQRRHLIHHNGKHNWYSS